MSEINTSRAVGDAVRRVENSSARKFFLVRRSAFGKDFAPRDCRRGGACRYNRVMDVTVIGLRRARRGIMRCGAAFCLVGLATAAMAQNSPINPPPAWPQVPQGAGACSVEKSCAELAPGMIRSALGASPLEENLGQLAHSAPGGAAGSRAADWAAEALRRAGVDRVHTEKFAVAAGDPAETETVVGEIRGRQKPDEFVLLGAPLAVPDPTNSAFDGGVDAAVVIDAARVIHASGTIPRRSIRFVLFTGTKPGKPGSRAYVAAHGAELDRMVAVVLFDAGAGPVNGYSLCGRKDTLEAVREALLPVRELGVEEFTLDAALRADSLDFLLEGVPTLVANVDFHNRVPSVRTDTGTLDPATVAELKRHAAIAAVSAFALADMEERVGLRLVRARIEQLLKDTGLDQQMKQEGLWSAWAKGERGRQP